MADEEHHSPNIETEEPTEELTSKEDLTQAIPGFHLLQKLGEGGMGEVFEAEQLEPVRRRVALKLIKRGMESKEVLARFDSERQALALMSHPNVAQVYDAGTTTDGRPYFVMEFVQGVSVTQYCDTNRLTTAERLGLFTQICDGVQHAHHKGVIHRDIKPSNVLVKVQDSKPVLKIIDFGVAKAISQRLTEQTLFTAIGEFIGTPEYMSPEQAEMTELDIDTRTDVYSLGVVLYEMLVGAQPFDARELRRSGIDEMRRKIREEEPPRPSVRLSGLGEQSTTAAKNRRSEPSTLARQLHGDLDWITMKALEKDRTRRYDTPGELAADIGRHLRNEPVLAGPPSATYRVNKFVRRHTIGVAASALVIVALVLGIAGTTIGMMKARTAEQTASREAATSKEVTEFLVGLFQVSDPGQARGNTITAREILDRGANDIEEKLADQPEVRARVKGTIGEVYTNLGFYGEAEKLLQSALEIQQGAFGGEHPETLRSMNRLANAYWYQRRFGEAEPLYSELVEGRRSVLGSEHPDTLMAQYDLASCYLGLEKYAEMEELSLRTLDAQRRILGEGHPDTLATLGNLAGMYYLQERYEESLQINETVFQKIRQLLGDDHPQVLLAMHNLATNYEKVGRSEEGEPLLIEAIDLHRRVLGDPHPDTAASIRALGLMYRKQGRFEEAESRLLEAWGDFKTMFGEEHKRSLALVGDLEELYEAWGKPEEEAEYRAMLVEREQPPE